VRQGLARGPVSLQLCTKVVSVLVINQRSNRTTKCRKRIQDFRCRSYCKVYFNTKKRKFDMS